MFPTDLNSKERRIYEITTRRLRVLGKLPSRKIAPSPNSSANPKPNPEPD